MKHNRSKPHFLIAFAFLAVAISSIQAATILDGNFENPALPSNSSQGYTNSQTIGGAWLVLASVGSGVSLVNGSAGLPATPDGNQFLFFSDGIRQTSLVQNISGSLSGGEVFFIQFLQTTFLNSTVFGRVNLQVSPTAGGAAIYNNDFYVLGVTSWIEQTATISVPTTGSYTMSFTSFPGTVGAIDRVAIVPEPSTICFLLIGVTLLSTRKMA